MDDDRQFDADSFVCAMDRSVRVPRALQHELDTFMTLMDGILEKKTGEWENARVEWAIVRKDGWRTLEAYVLGQGETLIRAESGCKIQSTWNDAETDQYEARPAVVFPFFQP